MAFRVSLWSPSSCLYFELDVRACSCFHFLRLHERTALLVQNKRFKGQFYCTGELASAIVRRNSIGREATLSIDERLTQKKQQREASPQNELVNALKKRKVSVEQGNKATEVRSPTEKELVAGENANIATDSSQKDSEVSASYTFSTC